jgi:hypothetical protein
MAQMMAMPIEAAVNAPLMDSSPFPDDMDTMWVAAGAAGVQGCRGGSWPQGLWGC